MIGMKKKLNRNKKKNFFSNDGAKKIQRLYKKKKAVPHTNPKNAAFFFEDGANYTKQNANQIIFKKFMCKYFFPTLCFF